MQCHCNAKELQLDGPNTTIVPQLQHRTGKARQGKAMRSGCECRRTLRSRISKTLKECRMEDPP